MKEKRNYEALSWKWASIGVVAATIITLNASVSFHHAQQWSFLFVWLVKFGVTLTVSAVVFTLERPDGSEGWLGFILKNLTCRIIFYGLMSLGFTLFVITLLGAFDPVKMFLSGWVIEELLFQDLVIIMTVLWTEASRLVGAHPIEKLVLGKYHLPTQERRVFLFIDLIGSTEMAQKLGNERFSMLTNSFFNEIDKAAAKYKGEIYQYAGDQVILSWPASGSGNFRSAFQSFLELQKLMERKISMYEDKFGTTPEFRGALHQGKVVVTWVGSTKREILFQGEVLNTTARIMDMAKKLSQPILISSEVARKLIPSFADKITYSGLYKVKGIEGDLALYGLKPKQERIRSWDLLKEEVRSAA